jgi:plastocyanin
MRVITRRAVLALSMSAAIATPTTLALASGGVGEAAGTHVVILKHKRFIPSTLTIKRGESVTWVWRDGSTRHNVTGPGFRSRTQSHGTFTVRFGRKGTVHYRCTIHVAEGMVGKVVVR